MIGHGAIRLLILIINHIVCAMSGWPSGLRRQTQGYLVYFVDGMSVLVLSEGVGSNPTPDNFFFIETFLNFPLIINIM
jgi:hypothetical protein